MKNVVMILISAFLMTMCANEHSINSKQLVGQYTIDAQPIVNTLADEKLASEDAELVNLGANIATAVLDLMDIKINFYEGEKGVLETNLWGVELVRECTGLDVKRITKFDYKIENDSILSVKGEESDGYERVGTLRKMADNYDFLELHANGYHVNLVKVAAE